MADFLRRLLEVLRPGGRAWFWVGVQLNFCLRMHCGGRAEFSPRSKTNGCLSSEHFLYNIAICCGKAAWQKQRGRSTVEYSLRDAASTKVLYVSHAGTPLPTPNTDNNHLGPYSVSGGRPKKNMTVETLYLFVAY